jgi:D-alanyl-D-alanine carboxypeptidase
VADWRVATLQARGYPVTKSNMNLLTAWQKMEGGDTHNDATFNPLNTTRNAPGAVRSINSVGVKAFDTFEHGISATVSTLDNYETISKYLAAGKGSDALRDPAGQGDFNMWVSGKDRPGASPYVSKIASILGQDVGKASVALGGQTYGGGKSPQAAQAKLADSIGAQKQMTAGFLMQAAHDTISGNALGGGSLLQLAQARKSMQEQADFSQADLSANLEARGQHPQQNGPTGNLPTQGGGGWKGVDTDGFTDDFDSRLNALVKASNGRLSITSGYRSADYQAKLYADAVKKYGSEAAARKWVAPPGKSNHGRGTAADIGGDLAWAHANAAKYGLHFPMSWENWHIEPINK